MNLGMFFGWAFLSPLARKNGWAPGDVGNSDNGSRGVLIVAIHLLNFHARSQHTFTHIVPMSQCLMNPS